MKTRLHAALLATVAALMAGACKQGPDYTPTPVAEFEQFRDSTVTTESIANLTWWELFADTTLQQLIEVADQKLNELRSLNGVPNPLAAPPADGQLTRGNGSDFLADDPFCGNDVRP